MTEDGRAWDALEVDDDLVMDPSMYGSFRYAQIMRWPDRYFLSASIESLLYTDLPAKRAENLYKELLQEGTEDV